MRFLIISSIVGLILLIGYIIQLNKTIKIQSKIIKKLEDNFKSYKRVVDDIQRINDYQSINYKSYKRVVDDIQRINDYQSINYKCIEELYDMDEILNEISKNGIKNVSKEKLDFLKKIRNK